LYRKLYKLTLDFIFMRDVLTMEITTYTAFRQHLKAFLDKVLLNRAPLFVTRTNGEDVVVMSKADYDSMQETFYLIKSPKNAARLLDALSDFEKGKGGERALIEE
jgi:antitoxin YefM